MTADERSSPHRPARSLRGRAALGVGAVAAVLMAAGLTWALWSGEDAAAGAVIRAGDLDVTLGAATWTETSPDILDEPRAIDPAQFLAMPGDVVVLRQDFVTTLEGDNIAGEVTVRWTDPEPQLLAGVDASYHVYGPDERTTGVVGVGERVVLPGTPSGQVTWTVLVEFALDPDADPAYAVGPAVQEPVPVADLGNLVIDLQQVRPDPGSGP